MKRYRKVNYILVRSSAEKGPRVKQRLLTVWKYQPRRYKKPVLKSKNYNLSILFLIRPISYTPPYAFLWFFFDAAPFFDSFFLTFCFSFFWQNFFPKVFVFDAFFWKKWQILLNNVLFYPFFGKKLVKRCISKQILIGNFL